MSGSADNTVKLWEVRTGRCIKTWNFNTAVKRVEFNETGTQVLAVTEQRMGFLGSIVVLDINQDLEGEQSDDFAMTITCQDSKPTVAGWSYLSRYIIAGHEDGTISQFDGKSGELIFNTPVHEMATDNAGKVLTTINDLQWAPDRTYFITASKDKTAKVSYLAYCHPF